jgi:hypothetical protein
MTPRQRRTDDPFYQLEKLRPHAAPDWLARVDRTMRLGVHWPQGECDRARRDGLVGKSLAFVRSRGNHHTQFPKSMEAGDYLYVFTFRGQLMLVGRMRVRQRVEGTLGGLTMVAFTTGVEGTEGTPVRFDRPVTGEALGRLSWFSGKKERFLYLDAEGRLTTPTSLSSVLRLTPRTAADLDAILRGDSPS